MKKELLCSLELHGRTRTTCSKISNAANGYFLKYSIEWKRCVGICKGCAASMTVHRSEVAAKTKNVITSDILFTHRIIHHERLIYILSDVIKIIIAFRQKALNSRKLEAFCKEIGPQHIHGLSHAEVRWLSKGKVLT
ncbi:unnamed protein product [Soboliphyme baturini]|uniref:Integrase n=1 Tax=Soboliphyme baturini TaxID=241478 RepID=A0A183IIH1_9BILA|nr:unnamed protein product [Soboliphyme baturini]